MCGMEAEDVTHTVLHCEAYDELPGKMLTEIIKATNKAINKAINKATNGE
ncbi:MAG TPA: hypothetical protein V6C97_01125 [Oculatellaceae cyanobacterium]